MVLPKYILEYDKKKEKRLLENDKTDKTLRNPEIKKEATKCGVLKKILGSAGSSVKIQKMMADIKRKEYILKVKDPKESKG
jgi:hypothetical protein